MSMFIMHISTLDVQKKLDKNGINLGYKHTKRKSCNTNLKKKITQQYILNATLASIRTLSHIFNLLNFFILFLIQHTAFHFTPLSQLKFLFFFCCILVFFLHIRYKFIATTTPIFFFAINITATFY